MTDINIKSNKLTIDIKTKTNNLSENLNKIKENKTNEFINSNFNKFSNKFNKEIFKKCVYIGFRRSKTVPLFTIFDAYDILMKENNNYFNYTFNFSREQSDFFINLLIENSIIIGSDVFDKSGNLFDDKINFKEPLSLQKDKFDLTKYIECDINLKRNKNIFILMNPPINYKLILCSILSILFVLIMSGYQVWPDFLKRQTYLLLQLFLIFTAFIFLLAAFRLLFFIITYFTSYPGIWIFPHLFADIGFIESFKPLWEKAKLTDYETKNK